MAKHAKVRHRYLKRTHDSKGEEKKDSKLRGVIFFIFLIVFLFSTINLIRWAIYNKKSSDVIEDIIEESFTEPVNQSENEVVSKNPVDFASLEEINSDSVAWIKIAGTSINYPIVQTTDNDYYLHNDIYKKYSTCGWIFMDFKNHEDFIDKNTVIYGHNIKSGLMFADLQKIYRNELGNEVTIEIYTPKEKLNYRVFSCYMKEPDDYAIKSNLVEESDQEKYIKEMLNRTSIVYNIVPDKTDKLLTLSTCDSTGKNRILVHSVYVGGEKF